ncbi:MAG: hypothetical protein AUJ97_07820 [Bacteroidetes bacterium CG2_30_32_10]|nr:MAG: hypothetical protein AUJ97_07820 [Bacteroidetes bacterium CG2_30_32_10]
MSIKKEAVNEFDLRANTWDDNPIIIERSKAVAESIKKQININKQMKGFEFGCGTGLVSINLQPYLKTITLADNSQGMLNVVKEKIRKQKFSNLNILKTDLIQGKIPTEKFDIIYTVMTMHHIADINAILTRFHFLLNNMGYLAIVDLDKEDGSFHGNDFIGHKGFDRKEMHHLFEKNGFKNIRNETCYEIVRKDEQKTERTYPLFIMIGEK